MSMIFDDIACGSQIFCGAGSPIALGLGQSKIRGAAFIEGPHIIGRATEFSKVAGCVMIAPLNNPDSPQPFVPGALCRPVGNPFSLIVSGNTGIIGQLDVEEMIQSGANVIAAGEVMSQCGGHILSAKKNFDIPHPSKKGWRLRHTCPEGPSNDVYFRGRVTKNEIVLPLYWKDFIDWTTITVTLTPIGAHQDVIVKRWDEEKVYLQAKGGIPINCFFQIFATRVDGEKLIPEYPGQSPEDYPGNNNEYSISGYHYDIKEEV
jgi:hypothetical protein